LVFDGTPKELAPDGKSLETQFHRLTSQPA
jgi:hypothetical protein